jgi:hypothetical protein
MDYDFIAAVEKRYNNMLSLGGDTEKSYWQNVGKIVNKKEFAEMEDGAFSKIMNNVNKIIKGERK